MKTIIEILQAQILLGAFAALVLGYATDFIWCRWMQSVAQDNALKAGLFSVYIGIVGFVYTSIIVSNEWILVLMYWCGCFYGSYKAVKK